MSFVTKEWKDRLAEFAGRRKLTNVSTGEETTVDVSRAEGEVSQAGDAFSAANMNDLEQRIKDGFDKVDTNLTANSNQFYFDYKDGKYGCNIDPNRGADTFIPFLSEVEWLTEQYINTSYSGAAGLSYSGLAPKSGKLCVRMMYTRTGVTFGTQSVKINENIISQSELWWNGYGAKYEADISKGDSISISLVGSSGTGNQLGCMLAYIQ